MRLSALLLAAAIVGCSKRDAPPPAATSQAAAAPVQPTTPGCPATGQWEVCSVLYRLGRAGLAPRVDSSAKPSEKELTGKPLVIKIGINAQLELYLYPDTAARAADAKKLDRTQLVTDTATQTIKRERTLIESSNAIGLLTSINTHQRERVADALLAGPPQPATKP
ncbi:MAG: hypothetical protein JWM41_4980 [Gemmatimonadetes bacterium]|nr:hypothetical protein [Gemmatimonadota bacterium]